MYAALILNRSYAPLPPSPGRGCLEANSFLGATTRIKPLSCEGFPSRPPPVLIYGPKERTSPVLGRSTSHSASGPKAPDQTAEPARKPKHSKEQVGLTGRTAQVGKELETNAKNLKRRIDIDN